jgi:hypothetical protein
MKLKVVLAAPSPHEVFAEDLDCSSFVGVPVKANGRSDGTDKPLGPRQAQSPTRAGHDPHRSG